MVSCPGKIHNLPTTIKTKSELATLVFSISILLFKLTSASFPAVLISGLHDHTYSLILFSVFHPQWKTFAFASFGFKLLNYK